MFVVQNWRSQLFWGIVPVLKTFLPLFRSSQDSLSTFLYVLLSTNYHQLHMAGYYNLLHTEQTKTSYTMKSFKHIESFKKSVLMLET
jgi:hypothetical protein